MMFKRRSSLGCAATFAVLLAAGDLRGMDILDDFEDDSIDDGTPLRWLRQHPTDPSCLHGSLSCENGRIILGHPDDGTFVGTTTLLPFPGNASIEAQGTCTGNGMLGLFVHGGTCGYSYGVEVGFGTGPFWEPGDVFFGYSYGSSGFTPLGSAVLDPAPQPGEDIILRLDSLNGMLELRIWRPGEEMPEEPLLRGEPIHIDGAMSGIFGVLPIAGVEATFEYVRFLEPQPFRRGDSNADGAIDISDAIATLTDLFRGTQKLQCMSAADSNDDGSVDVSDGTFLLDFLFRGKAAPKSPYPGCGIEERIDALGCREYPSCE